MALVAACCLAVVAGVPAAAVLGPRSRLTWLTGQLVRLGDASYGLHLTHYLPFVACEGLAAGGTHPARLHGGRSVVAATACLVLVASAVHRWV